MITFKIFGEPEGKGRPRFYRRGRFVGVYTPDATRHNENNIRFQALPHKPKVPIKGPVIVNIKFYFAIPKSRKDLQVGSPCLKKPDIDNLIKSVLDPLNGLFWEDDKQVCSVNAIKLYGDEPRTEVEIG